MQNLYDIIFIFLLLLIIIIIFIKIAIKVRKYGGSMVTTMFGATYQFYNKDKKEAIEHVVEIKTNKKFEEQSSSDPQNKLFNMISLKNISKNYNDVTALKSVSFEIKEGEIFGYIGPNGAGKTTTIKIIVGLLKDFSGDYHFKNIKMPKNITEVSQMLGYLPQGVAFHEWRTVDQALKTFGRLSGLEKEEIEQQINILLELLDLSNVRYKKISKLSGGMIQKVGLAQALLHNPKLLILDEPLSGLDPVGRFEVKSFIKKLSEKGTTIFFSSHILSDVQDIADRIAILKKGHILKIGSIDELKSELFSANTIEIQFFSNFENLSVLKTLSGITRVEQHSAKSIFIHINDEFDVDEIYYQILKYLVQQKAHIRIFKQVELNLDELYLKYIGSN